MGKERFVKPSRTTNRLHFSDLDPLRFEDLCLNLVYRQRPWIDIRHYGRKGSDGGIDIFATEDVDGQQLMWNVQCRRYSNANNAMLKKIVDDVVISSKDVPHTLLAIIACDLRRDVQESFATYALSKNISRPMLWTATVLEAQIYNEHPDILFTYFGVSKQVHQNNRKREIENRIRLRKKLSDVLLNRNYDARAAMKCPATKFRAGYVMVHDIEDATYPRFEEREGISPWFRLQLYDIRSDGIECYLFCDDGRLNKDGYWAIGRDAWLLDPNESKAISICTIGCIAYDNIVTVDYEGDEYYSFPHLYCTFKGNDGPYCRIRYVYMAADTDFDVDLDSRLQRIANDSTSNP